MINPSASRNLILEIEISGNSVRKTAITCPMLRVADAVGEFSDAGVGLIVHASGASFGGHVTGESAGFGIMREG